jgi:hypothetical protein
MLLKPLTRPLIIVDWSDCENEQDYMMLKAAVPVGGRAISVYEQVHPRESYNTTNAHNLFLSKLKMVLPESCRPIIITDAGFRGPWCQAVRRLGWDWVGRIRGNVNYSFNKQEGWQETKTLYPTATKDPRNVGHVWLAKGRPYDCHLYIMRKNHRRSGRPRKRHGLNEVAQNARKKSKEPWLIATSLDPKEYSAARIMKLYALRMQIEETFRDLKGYRWGFGLKHSRSRGVKRLEILLLIGTLAMLVSWIIGLAGKMRGLMKYFQANTEKRRNVLSLVNFGLQLFTWKHFKLTIKELRDTVKILPILIEEEAQNV